MTALPVLWSTTSLTNFGGDVWKTTDARLQLEEYVTRCFGFAGGAFTGALFVESVGGAPAVVDDAFPHPVTSRATTSASASLTSSRRTHGGAGYSQS